MVYIPLSIALHILIAHNFMLDLKYSMHILKMAAYSLCSELAREVNRHFIVNEYGDQPFFLFFLIEQ